MFGKYYPLLSPQIDLLGDFDSGNSTDCPGGNEWILAHFGQCVSSGPQWASFVLGFISLLIWFFPGLPQIYQNYKRGTCEEALSPIFLLFWFFGDSMNLTGAILTKQLPVQIYVGFYYILQDCVILGQYVYYKAKNRWRVRLIQDLGAADNRSTILNALFYSIFLISGGVFVSKSALNFGIVDQPSENFRSRVLLAPIFNGATDEIGYVCGLLSSISYLSGRIPQLIKNYKRRSTEGVSIDMYILLCIGNATYGASVLLGCEGDVTVYYARHLPWLIGSLACLCIDAFVFVQYFRYKDLNKEEDLLPIIDDQSQPINDPVA